MFKTKAEKKKFGPRWSKHCKIFLFNYEIFFYNEIFCYNEIFFYNYEIFFYKDTGGNQQYLMKTVATHPTSLIFRYFVFLN